MRRVILCEKIHFVRGIYILCEEIHFVLDISVHERTFCARHLVQEETHFVRDILCKKRHFVRDTLCEKKQFVLRKTPAQHCPRPRLFLFTQGGVQEKPHTIPVASTRMGESWRQKWGRSRMDGVVEKESIRGCGGGG